MEIGRWKRTVNEECPRVGDQEHSDSRKNETEEVDDNDETTNDTAWIITALGMR